MTTKEALANIYNKVNFLNDTYTLTEVIFWRDKATMDCKYSCTLLDSNKNSVVRAPIERVDLING